MYGRLCLLSGGEVVLRTLRRRFTPPRRALPDAVQPVSLAAVLSAALLTILFLRPGGGLAAGTVGTGSPASCTEAALDTALAGGGLVTFNCGSSPVQITLT